MGRRKEERRRYLTDSVIAALPSARADQKNGYMVWDTEQAYLALRIYMNGRRCWYYVRKLAAPNGIKLKLGDWPLMRADQAREIVAKMDVAAKTGVHPKQFRRRLVWADTTVRGLFQEYIDKHLKVHAAQRTIDDVQNSWQRYMEAILDIPATALTSIELQEWVNALAEKRGKETAGKQFRLLKACLNFAHMHGLCEFKRMPTLGVKPPKNHNSRRLEYLTAEQYPRFEAAVNGLANQDHADIIRVALFTGARRGNVKAMRWANIDIACRVWRIPGADAKGRKDLVVPLCDSMLMLLERRRRDAANESAWVFPADSSSGHVEDFTKSWNVVRERACLKHLVFHSLRHTVGSHMGLVGCSSFKIQRQLGHASSKTSEIYTHLDSDVQALEKALANLRSTAPPVPAGVVRLSPRRPEALAK